MNKHTTFPDTAKATPELDDEAAWETLRAECELEFREWQREGIRGLRECDNNPREDASFSAWLIDRARPHMIDCERYQEAMDWTERSLVKLDEVAAGHKRFNREMGRG